MRFARALFSDDLLTGLIDRWIGMPRNELIDDIMAGIYRAEYAFSLNPGFLTLAYMSFPGFAVDLPVQLRAIMHSHSSSLYLLWGPSSMRTNLPTASTHKSIITWRGRRLGSPQQVKHQH